jgi:hypothetical protein
MSLVCFHGRVIEPGPRSGILTAGNRKAVLVHIQYKKEGERLCQ